MIKNNEFFRQRVRKNLFNLEPFNFLLCSLKMLLKRPPYRKHNNRFLTLFYAKIVMMMIFFFYCITRWLLDKNVQTFHLFLWVTCKIWTQIRKLIHFPLYLKILAILPSANSQKPLKQRLHFLTRISLNFEKISRGGKFFGLVLKEGTIC